jgi:hypothetical protein
MRRLILLGEMTYNSWRLWKTATKNSFWWAEVGQVSPRRGIPTLPSSAAMENHPTQNPSRLNFPVPQTNPNQFCSIPYPSNLEKLNMAIFLVGSQNHA